MLGGAIIYYKGPALYIPFLRDRSLYSPMHRIGTHSFARSVGICWWLWVWHGAMFGTLGLYTPSIHLYIVAFELLVYTCAFLIPSLRKYSIISQNPGSDHAAITSQSNIGRLRARFVARTLPGVGGRKRSKGPYAIYAKATKSHHVPRHKRDIYVCVLV